MEKAIVDHAHSLGAKVKLHICGNTIAILPDMILTGADIVDVDHLVGSMKKFLPLLSANQVFSGNTDPVSVIQNGTLAQVEASVQSCFTSTKGRGIVSAGCEITPETTVERLSAYSAIAHRLNV